MERQPLNKALYQATEAMQTAKVQMEAINNIIPLLRSELQKNAPDKIAFINELEIAMKTGDIKKILELRNNL